MKHNTSTLQIIRRTFVLLFTVGMLLLPSTSVGAADVLNPVCNSPDTAQATLCQENANNQTPENNSIYGPNGIITKAARILSIVVGVAAIIMIMVGGVKYILSQGDAANVQSSRNTILYAVVGLVIAALAQAFVIFIAKVVP